MARCGPKPRPDSVKLLKGTFQPSRARAPIVATLVGDVVPPKWLKGEALKVWREKVAIYAHRSQSVVGCEGSLAQYCGLEADLIDSWKRKVDIPVAKINAHRIYASEFYDTPASQQGPRKKDQEGNRFVGNGRDFRAFEELKICLLR